MACKGDFSNIIVQRIKHRADALIRMGTVRGNWELDYINLIAVRERYKQFLQSNRDPNAILHAAFSILKEPLDNEFLFVFVPRYLPAFAIIKSRDIGLTKIQHEMALRMDETYTPQEFKNVYFTPFDVPPKFRACPLQKIHMWCIML